MKYTLRKVEDNEQMPVALNVEPKPASKIKGKKLSVFPENYIVVDIETTGLNPKANEIIELSAIKIKDGKIIDEFNSLVKPKGRISSFITQLTGITDEMVSNAADIKKAIKDFNDFCHGSVIIGHNVTFDIGFINTKLQKYHDISFVNDYIDTLKLARLLLPQLINRKLSTIAGHFGLDTEGMHRGMKDCVVTNSCYERFKELAVEKYGTLENFPIK